MGDVAEGVFIRIQRALGNILGTNGVTGIHIGGFVDFTIAVGIPGNGDQSALDEEDILEVVVVFLEKGAVLVIHQEAFINADVIVIRIDELRQCLNLHSVAADGDIGIGGDTVVVGRDIHDAAADGNIVVGMEAVTMIGMNL